MRRPVRLRARERGIRQSVQADRPVPLVRLVRVQGHVHRHRGRRTRAVGPAGRWRHRCRCAVRAGRAGAGRRDRRGTGRCRVRGRWLLPRHLGGRPLLGPAGRAGVSAGPAARYCRVCRAVRTCRRATACHGRDRQWRHVRRCLRIGRSMDADHPGRGAGGRVRARVADGTRPPRPGQRRAGRRGRR